MRLGIAAFVFFLVGIVFGGPIDISSMSGEDVVAHYEDNKNQAFMAFIAIGLSVFCLLWFLGAIRARLSGQGVGADRLAGTSFGAGMAFAALLLAGRAAAGTPTAIYNFGFEGAQLDPVAASLFNYLAYDLWALAGVAASVCVTALSVAGRLTGSIPHWVARIGYVVAVIAFASAAFPYGTLALVMLWLAVVAWSSIPVV